VFAKACNTPSSSVPTEFFKLASCKTASPPVKFEIASAFAFILASSLKSASLRDVACDK
jgi:hypothetical protein